MLQENENLQLQNVALGQNILEKQNDVASATEEGYFGKPEFYDYSQVQLPENYYYDQNLLNEFNELAGKYNLSQKSANELMSMAVKLTQLMNSKYSEALTEQNRQKISNYRQMLSADREIGGVNLDKTMRTANIAYTQFADKDVQSLLSETGLNCHPKVVKMFYNIGQKMQNDSIYGMNHAVVPKENREDILFPTM